MDHIFLSQWRKKIIFCQHRNNITTSAKLLVLGAHSLEYFKDESYKWFHTKTANETQS